MSASVHSQASSRPQSTVSGIPVANAHNDVASTTSHHTTEVVKQHLIDAQPVVETLMEPVTTAGEAENTHQHTTTTTVQTTTYTTEGGAVPLMGAVVSNRGVEISSAEAAGATTTTTTYTSAPVMTYNATSSGAIVTGGSTSATAVRSSDIDPSMFGENCYTHTRKVSNVIVSETLLGQVPQQDEIRYVEADPSRFPPEERVTHVIKKETREKVVEKKVPVIEYVERVVEVPRVEYIDRTVEVPQIQEVYVDQRVPQVVDRVVEVVKEVPIVKDKIVERVVEVPGGVIEVPKPYPVHVEKEVFRAVETEKPVIVAQVVKPVIKESSKQLVVDVMDYEPEVIPVDVHVAKPVGSALELVSSSEVRHRLVNITSAQYNTILRQLNHHVDGKFQVGLPYVRENGQTLFLKNEQIHYIEAPVDVRIEGYIPKHSAAAVQPIEVINRGPASTYTSAVAYRGGCPTNITQAMQVCTTATGRNQQQQIVETVVPMIQTETRSLQQPSIHQTSSVHAATSMQQHHQPVVTAQYGTSGVVVEVPRSAVDAAQSLIHSAAQYNGEEIKMATRDMAPVQTGSEVRTFPGAASLPREGGSIRSQLPAQQPSRICC